MYRLPDHIVRLCRFAIQPDCLQGNRVRLVHIRIHWPRLRQHHHVYDSLVRAASTYLCADRNIQLRGKRKHIECVSNHPDDICRQWFSMSNIETSAYPNDGKYCRLDRRPHTSDCSKWQRQPSNALPTSMRHSSKCVPMDPI